jgi:hypothetical protein
MNQVTTMASMRAATSDQQANLPAVQMGFGSNQSFELMQRVSKMFASSTLVPAAYQGNISNCCVALNMAHRMGADPLMVMQNLYIVHGNPSWSSKFMIASVNVCGRFSALRYEWRGENGKSDQACRAWAIEKETNERLDGAWITWEMVEKEGWSKKSGSKWLSMRDQMFIYRAAAFWQRAYAPELTMGLSTAEEQTDIIDMHDDGSYTVTTEQLRAGQARAAEIVESNQGEATIAQEGATTANATEQEELKAESTEALTFAQVADSLERAKDIDVLDVAADLIGAVADKAQQKELTALYNKRRKQIEAA